MNLDTLQSCIVGNILNMQEFLITESAHYSLKKLKAMPMDKLWQYHDSLLAMLKNVMDI